MQIANIYPIANQEVYIGEDIVMILAHLLKKGLYAKKYFSNKQYTIMDNGLFEKEQISTNVLDCINLAENSGIRINEIIIPDAINDLDKTIRLFEENLESIIKWNAKYKFMFVAQSTTYKELKKAIQYINYWHPKLNLAVGISKLSPLDRGSEEAIEIYRQCSFPIHFLGIKKTFSELERVSKIIRSCDTSQFAFIDKNKVITQTYSYARNGIDIDLEHDVCNSMHLRLLRNMFQAEAKINGLL